MKKVSCHKEDFDKELNKVVNWNISLIEKNKLKEFFEEYKQGEITNRTSRNYERSFSRYLNSLKISLENLNNFTNEDIKQFKNDLIADKIKHKKGKYSLRTKKDILQTLSRYISWRKPTLNLKPLKIKIELEEKDFDILNQVEIDKFIKETPQLDKKFFISILAASGVRAEEFHNIRYSDITFPSGNKTFLKIRIRSEFSKTKGRTLELYDKHSLIITKKYLNQRLKEGMQPEDPVFLLPYNTMKKWLPRNSEKILGKKVNYHLFRHTRATQLSHKMNRQQLCIYFGWRFSSNMPDKYIERSGVEMKEIGEKFKSTKVEKLEEQVNSQRELLKKVMEFMKKTSGITQEEIDNFENKGVGESVKPQLKS